MAEDSVSAPKRVRTRAATQAPSTIAPSAASEEVIAGPTGTVESADNAGDQPAPASKVRQAADTVKREAQTLKSQAAESARTAAETGKTRLASAASGLGRMVEDTALQIDSSIGEQYGNYARSAARAIDGFADRVEAKNVDELLDDARAYVKKSPAVAIGAAAVVGFVIARLLKTGTGDDRA